jgi:hypothetical protein
MKPTERRSNIRTTSGYLRHGYKNTLKCSHGGSESLPHKICKFWVAHWCWENGLQFWTEATFTNGGRADIVIGDFVLAVEILHTEDLKKFRAKNYPIETIAISSNTSGTDIMELLDDQTKALKRTENN